MGQKIKDKSKKIKVLILKSEWDRSQKSNTGMNNGITAKQYYSQTGKPENNE